MDSPKTGTEKSSEAIDPGDIGPCYDYCMCDYCWAGWVTLSYKERLIGRIEWLQRKVSKYHDIVRDGLPLTLEEADIQVRKAVDWFIERSANAPQQRG